MSDTTVRFDGEALKKYGDAAGNFQDAQSAYEEAMVSLDPLKVALEEAREAVKVTVEELGSDPFGILKSVKTGKGGPRGPRDPEKRNRVLEAANGATIADIVKHVNDTHGEDYVDKLYVNGVIGAARTKNPNSIVASGERGSKVYTYVAQAVSAPVEA